MPKKTTETQEKYPVPHSALCTNT